MESKYYNMMLDNIENREAQIYPIAFDKDFNLVYELRNNKGIFLGYNCLDNIDEEYSNLIFEDYGLDISELDLPKVHNISKIPVSIGEEVFIGNNEDKLNLLLAKIIDIGTLKYRNKTYLFQLLNINVSSLSIKVPYYIKMSDGSIDYKYDYIYINTYNTIEYPILEVLIKFGYEELVEEFQNIISSIKQKDSTYIPIANIDQAQGEYSDMMLRLNSNRLLFENNSEIFNFNTDLTAPILFTDYMDKSEKVSHYRLSYNSDFKNSHLLNHFKETGFDYLQFKRDILNGGPEEQVDIIKEYLSSLEEADIANYYLDMSLRLEAFNLGGDMEIIADILNEIGGVYLISNILATELFAYSLKAFNLLDDKNFSSLFHGLFNFHINSTNVKWINYIGSTSSLNLKKVIVKKQIAS